jgi:Protein kinase domain/zinc-ribbon domain
MLCTSCHRVVSDQANFCPNCGAALDSAADATLVGDSPVHQGETFAPGSTPKSSAHSSGSRSVRPASSAPRSPSSSDFIGGGRFTPGQIIAERYRIVALAGRGGMGEVYRAEDLKLVQVVAIKFLPAGLSQDAGALARFHSEVRIARQVSHPNVCRVFDIGDADGVPFLTMEYVDGEDLASLIRRIGRLSPDKAIEIARQACAGLAAAHEHGVIHRDLKPANLMLDGSGKIRITDFGLASIAAAMDASDVKAGTPAYMAPEQLEGKEVTVKSDLYSLGLVLYEILTGKRVYDGATLPELMRQRERTVPSSPSTLVRDLDPAVERVILRCLEIDPARRPASALQVAAALPGGDPLAAALAAGETPSPQMVAAAGSTEGIRPRLAITLFAVVILGVIGLLWSADHYRLQNLVPLDNPPEVLAARAREVVRHLGYTQPHTDEAFGFDVDYGYINYVADHDKSLNRWNVLSAGRPASIFFWYRESPREMRRLDSTDALGSSDLTPSDPPMDVTGMIEVFLDTQGRLFYFEEVPPQRDEAAKSNLIPDWSEPFAAAELDRSAYKSAEPQWAPLGFADARAAWTREQPGKLGITERIEAASYRGKPIYFDVIYPWRTPERQAASTQTQIEKLRAAFILALFLGIALTGIFVARRNVRLRRADTSGSFRLGTFVFLTYLAAWLLSAHHIASLDEFNLVVVALGWALLFSSLVMVLYLALEPYVRRRDPHTLIAWSRLLRGEWKDPLVGRDLLIGVSYGVILASFEGVDNFLLPLLGKSPPTPGGLQASSLLGVHDAIASLLLYVLIYVVYSLVIFFLLFALRLLVKRDWIAAILVAFLGAITNPSGEYPLLTYILLGIIWLSILLMLRRFGMFALVVGLVVQNVLVVFPMTFHLSRWYASAGLTGVVVILALTIYGFKTGLGGRPLFSAAALDT